MNYSPHEYRNSTVKSKLIVDVHDNNNIILKEIYPKVIYFTASWCGPCQRIGPVYEELSSKYRDILFFKVDVDENEKLAQDFNITSMPTFIFYKSKNNHKQLNGADKDKLISNVEKLMQ